MNAILTVAELQDRTQSELLALFRHASQMLVRTDAGTPERRNGLATLETISRMMALTPGAPGL
jgi:hypothetical protein